MSERQYDQSSGELSRKRHRYYSETRALNGQHDANGDAVFLVPESNIAFLFDGSGKGPDRIKAAKHALQIIASHTHSGHMGVLQSGLQTVHQELVAASDTDVLKLSAVALQIQDTEEGISAHVANVGKTRAYLLRDGTITQLTRDDGQRIVERHEEHVHAALDGITTKEELIKFKHASFGTLQGRYFWERRTVIAKELGGTMPEHIAVMEEPVQAGDRILLASGGLRNLTSKEIQASLAQKTVDPATLLVESAYRASLDRNRIRADRDDISAVVVDISTEKQQFRSTKKEFRLTEYPTTFPYESRPITLALSDGTILEFGRPEDMGFAKVPDDLFLALNREKNNKDGNEGYFWIPDTQQRFLVHHTENSTWHVSNFSIPHSTLRIRREGDSLLFQSLSKHDGAKIIVDEI